MDKRAQYLSVGSLGVFFMLMFTAFNSLQNMIASIYNQEGFHSLGQIALFAIYFIFGLTTFVSSFIIDKYGYKIVMFLCSIGYAIFQLTGLLVTSCAGHKNAVCNAGVIYTVVIIGALICGFSAGLIWIAQSGYVSDTATQQSKGQLFGLFWGLMMGSQILGNLFSTFVLGYISNFAYFAILGIIGVVSAFLFLLLPSVQNQKQKNTKPLIQRIVDVKQLIFQQGSFNIHLYYAFTGVTVACYAGFLYKLIDRAYVTDDSKDLKYHTGLVFIILGVSQVVTGILMNRFSDLFNKYRLASFGTLIVQAAAFVSLLTYFLQSYWLCFISSALWGISETFLQSNTGALISLQYKGTLQAYSVFRVFFAIGVTSTLLINIILSSAGAPDYVFIVLVIIFQIIVNITSETLQGRKVKKDSLLTQGSTISQTET